MLQNPFKHIIRNEKLPDTIKEKVMSDVAAIKLVIDISDLVMIKYPTSLDDIYKIARNKNKPKDK